MIDNMFVKIFSGFSNIKNVKYHSDGVDELTGGCSFSKFKEEARVFLERDSQQAFALMKFDIENFKLINRTFGFAIGDKVLQRVYKAIKTASHFEQKIYARLGDDEFVVLCNYVDYNHLEKVWKQFMSDFSASMEADFEYTIRFKTGVYIGDGDMRGKSKVEDLLELVNFAHQKAKQNRVEDIVFYEEHFPLDAIRQKDIENKMQRAITEEEFQVYLQPKYYLKEEAIGGAEALVRWCTKEGQLEYPNDFIPLFEKNGFITKLDFFMLEKVCEMQARRIENSHKLTVVSVNFSKQHLNNKDFVSQICKSVDRFHIDRKWIEIEFTETEMHENIQIFEDVLTKLHEAGFTVSMDDFGSGYSSLGLLKNLPVDVIKIDRSFFLNQKDEKRSNIVLSSIIDMAKQLGIITVAEGVEEERHIKLLRELNCDMVQGYYYASPMPVEEFEALLNA